MPEVIAYFHLSKFDDGSWVVGQQLEGADEPVGVVVTEEEADYISEVMAAAIRYLADERDRKSDARTWAEKLLGSLPAHWRQG